VLHVATPLSATSGDPDALISPALDGTLRALRAATAAGVRRVVLTSAANAASPASYATEGVTDETLWTDPDLPGLIPYRRAKTLAERAAWDYVAGRDGAPELVTILPGAVFGPVRTAGTISSAGIIARMLSGAMRFSPGSQPRPARETVLDCARSLIQHRALCGTVNLAGKAAGTDIRYVIYRVISDLAVAALRNLVASFLRFPGACCAARHRRSRQSSGNGTRSAKCRSNPRFATCVHVADLIHAAGTVAKARAWRRSYAGENSCLSASRRRGSLMHVMGASEEPGRDVDPGLLLDQAFTQSAVGLAVYDADVRYVRLNDALCRSKGLESESAALGLRPSEVSPDLGLASLEVAVERVLRTGQAAIWKGYSKARLQQGERAWLVIISPVLASDGQARGAMSVTFDVTEHRLARKRLALVNEASYRIGSSLDVTRTAEELAEVAVPALADLALIDVQDSVLTGAEPALGAIPGDAPLRRLAFQSVLDGAPEVVGRPGDVRSYPRDSPAARALSSGTAVVEDPDQLDLAGWAVRDPVRGQSASRYAFRSVMAVPLRARGATFGVASFVRHSRAEGFAADDQALAEEIVARAAVCIDNARRYTREHATALTLQHSLLQRRQPDPVAVEVATRYLPGQAGVSVGGDWLDVIALSGSRVGLVAGDVAGHGIHAAATMGRLRTAVRTLADLDLEPEELLTRLDDVVSRMASEHESASDASDLNATCLFAIYDPITQCCTLARAGHPVPVVMTPGGEPEFLDLPAGPPLGVGGVPFEEREIQLPEGSLLVMFTDGVVESREHDIDTGLKAMRQTLGDMHSRPGSPPSLDTVCGDLMDALNSAQAGDDAAVLAARMCALPSGHVVSWDLPADSAIVSEARARAVRQLADWGLEELAFTTELLVSELVTNAIRHAHPPIRLRMILDATLTCEVSDATIAAPRHRRADRYDEGGRGLMLVARLAEHWGTRYTRAGKTIWAQQRLPRGAARDR
jgi:PAS domain S-box-containing protein